MMKKYTESLRSRYHYGAIMLREMVIADFKLRYQGSILGYAWSLLKPMALFSVLYVVFVKILKIGGDVPHFGISLLLGIVIWTFFTEVTSQSLTSIVAKGDLIRKVKFPRYVISIAPAFSALINLTFNLAVVGLFILINHINLGLEAFLLPLLLLELFIFAGAIGAMLSALYVKFRDLTHVWEVVLQAAFYATPILYPLSLVPQKIAKLLMLNPLAQIIQDARYILISNQTQTIATIHGHWAYRLVPITLTLIVAAAAFMYFRHRSQFFAEEV